MYIDIDEIDVDRLRDDLISDCEAAYFVGGFGGAIIDMDEVENATDEEVVKLAIQNRIDINNYKKYKRY